MPGTSSAVEEGQGLFLGLLSVTYQDAEHLFESELPVLSTNINQALDA